MKLTRQRINDVVLKNERHKSYRETVKISDHLNFHIEGYEYDWYGEKMPLFTNFSHINFLEYPGNIWFDILIREYRPEEMEDSKSYEYRIKTYKPVTKSTISKVITEFQKITRSTDWSVKFSDDEPDGYPSLKEYFNNYPTWGSFTAFVQMVLVKMINLDPNAVAVVSPIYERDEDDTKLPEPVVTFYDSRSVMDYHEGEYAIVYEKDEDLFCVYTKDWVKKLKRSGDGLVEVMTHEYPEPLDTLNCKQLKGLYKHSSHKSVVYDSFLSPMLPSLDKAARESSDLDASTVRAMFPQAWQIAGLNCKRCGGSGKVKPVGLPAGQPVVCGECGGMGSVAHSPSQVLTVKMDRLAGEQQIPIPPKGFIEPSVAIIELQRQSVEDHKFDALASLNFHFLDVTPLNESGKAKEVDKDSLHASIQKVAENIVENCIWIAKSTCEIRYGMAATKELREKMLPKIAVPEDFSIITAEAYLAEMEKSKLSGVSVSTRRELELQYINKKWRNNEVEKKRCIAYIMLNPGYGMDVGQIGLSDMDVLDKVISLYIISFVDRAIEENENFLDLDMLAQMEVLKGYAEEKTPAPAEVDERDQ